MSHRKPSHKRFQKDPTIADATILMKVEDLINMAMGPPQKNTVNFKMLETVLYVLARQMRLLEQQVEVHVDGPPDPRHRGPAAHGPAGHGPRHHTGGTQAGVGVFHVQTDERLMYSGAYGPDRLTQQEEEITSTEPVGVTVEGTDAGGAGGTAAAAGPDGAPPADEAATATDKPPAETKATQGARAKMASAGVSADPSIMSPAEVEDHKKKFHKLVTEAEATPVAHRRVSKLGSIEIVTQSQFNLLERAVEEMKKTVGTVSHTYLPGTKELRDEILSGSASLTDAMQALQLTARVGALEQAILRLTDMLAALAAEGILPPGVAKHAAELQREVAQLAEEARSSHHGKARFPPGHPAHAAAAAAAAAAHGPPPHEAHPPHAAHAAHAQDAPAAAQAGRPGGAGGGYAAGWQPGATLGDFEAPADDMRRQSTQAGEKFYLAPDGTKQPCISPEDMDDAMSILWERLAKRMLEMSGRATSAAESAMATSKIIVQKLDVALQLDHRIMTLQGVITEYAAQLEGFDAGFTSQIQSFQDQITQLRAELNAGLEQLKCVNNTAETAALIELQERYEALTAEQEITMTHHKELTAYQGHLSQEIQSLIECVELLHDEKADRDEVLDGLRDKADVSRIEGLVPEPIFEAAYRDLQERLEVCNEKFQRQEGVWMQALGDFSQLLLSKASLMQMLSIHDEAQRGLRQLHSRVQLLTRIVGDPKAAVLIRKLSLEGRCAACGVQALMDPHAARNIPPALRARRRGGGGALQPLPPADEPTRPPGLPPPSEPGDKVHMCHRWTGGSHTLTGAAGAVGRETAQRPLPLPPPAKRYIGVGDDGRAYKLARDLEPCVECNQMIPGAAEVAEAAVAGAGDQVTVVTVDDAKKTVVDGDALAQPAESDGDAGPRRSTVGAGAGATAEYRRTTLGPVGSVVQGRITAVEPAAVLQAAARHEAALRRAEREATRASRAEAAGVPAIAEAAADAENAAAAEHGDAPAADDEGGDKGNDGDGNKGDEDEGGDGGGESSKGGDDGNNGDEGDPPGLPTPEGFLQ